MNTNTNTNADRIALHTLFHNGATAEAAATSTGLSIATVEAAYDTWREAAVRGTPTTHSVVKLRAGDLNASYIGAHISAGEAYEGDLVEGYTLVAIERRTARVLGVEMIHLIYAVGGGRCTVGADEPITVKLNDDDPDF